MSDSDSEKEIKVHKKKRITMPEDDGDEMDTSGSKPNPTGHPPPPKTPTSSSSSSSNKKSKVDDDDVPLAVTKQKVKEEKKSTPLKKSSSSSYYSDEDEPPAKPKKESNGKDKGNGSAQKKPPKQEMDPDDLPLSKKLKSTPSSDTKKTPPVVKEEKATPNKSDKQTKEENPNKAKASSSITPKKQEATPKKQPTPSSSKKPTPSSSKKKQESESESESESDSDSSSSDSDSGKKKKQKKKSSTKTPTKRSSKKSSDESKKDKKEKKPAEEVYEWWKEEPLPDGQYWRTLSHNGVIFPPPYKPHGVKMLYDGKPVDLPPEVEEVASFYAQHLESDHVKKAVFNKNFFDDFKQVLKKHKIKTIKEFSKCDFSPIHKYLVEQKELKKNRSAEEKKAEKEEKQRLTDKYGIAIVDGHKEKISNYRVEPPGLFLGRGAHPKTGKVKARIQPEDITLNMGEEADVPPPPDGHHWKEIIHDNAVSWLAMWRENINDGFKYVWLAPSSRTKGRADMKKYEVARKLKKHIGKIRDVYVKELKDSDVAIKQRATALWVIDHLALRVGNEKAEDEADTVGCCSLRVEHIKLEEPTTVHFDFLGKDSMRYQNTVQVDELVFKNLKSFVKGKKPGADLFDKLTTSALNTHLKEQMDGLTAKVFRTYNASITLETELAKMPRDLNTIDEKVLFYNRCNREVAILCNHQKTVSKTFNSTIQKLDDKLAELIEERRTLEAMLKGKKVNKSSDSESDDDEKKKKKKKLPTDPDKIKAAIKRLDQRIAKWEITKQNKDETKNVALGTSKLNYLDPRISVAWCRKADVPIEKIFSPTLRKKFPWAMDVTKDWAF